MATTETDSAGVAERNAAALMNNPIAPPLPDLTPRQELALLARMLHREGYDDHLAGHITYTQEDGTILCNPFGLPWDEIRAGDVMTMDAEGNTIAGPWTITPAIELHLAVHRQRDDARVIVHNHPEYGTVWADTHRIPPVYDQTSAQVYDDLVLYDEYDGDVANRENARKAAEALGTHRMALLANHGVLVVGDSIRQAHHRAVYLEWRCKMAWKVDAVGGGKALPDSFVAEFGGIFDHVPFPGLFEAGARREIRFDPTVLEETPTP